MKMYNLVTLGEHKKDSISLLNAHCLTSKVYVISMVMLSVTNHEMYP